LQDVVKMSGKLQLTLLGIGKLVSSRIISHSSIVLHANTLVEANIRQEGLASYVSLKETFNSFVIVS
jgi:hypothetical protein